MALDIGTPLVEKVLFAEADPSGKTWVRIRTARHHEELERNNELGKQMVVERVDGTRQIDRGVTWGDLRILECRITFEGCNILMGKKPLFTIEMKDDHAAFEEAFGKLPLEIAIEWQKLVWGVNPEWDPIRTLRESTETESEEESETTLES
jgi:hypothetical protein